MKVGVLQFELEIPASRSLKDKRRVVKSLKDRLHREHLVAVAEVGAWQIHNLAVLGVAAVSADGAYLRAMLDHIVRKVSLLPEARLRDAQIDLIEPESAPGGEGDEPLWTPDQRREPLGETP